MSNNKYPINYNLFETGYGNDYPIEQIFVHLFDMTPSRTRVKDKYTKNILQYFIEKNGFKILAINSFTSKRYEEPMNETILCHEEKNQIIVLKNIFLGSKIEPYMDMAFYYNHSKGEFSKQFDLDTIKSFIAKPNKSSISLVKSEGGHLDIEEYDLKVPDMDLTLNYGKSFMKVHNVIINRLNKENDKGIILFHGDPGTGKTSYLKYLTKIVKDKEILFIPPSMAESLAEPSIIPFLMEHKNSILIVEDAERVISDRETNGASAAVSNILNLTDGILGDCLNIQIIATFNMKREKIDPALLRKGRLIAEHKFEKLSIEDTKKLLTHLGKTSNDIKEEMCLADIYNIDEELIKTKENKKIGFKTN